MEAQNYYDQAIDMDHKVSGENVRNENHAKTILNRGNMAVKLGKYKEARNFLGKALNMFYHIYGGADAKNIDIAVVLCSLANLFRFQRDFDQSEDFYLKALGMLYAIFGRESRNAFIAETLYNIGILQQDMKRPETAKIYHEKALQIMVGTMGNDSSEHPFVHKIAHELIKIESLTEREPGICWIPGIGKKNKKAMDDCRFF